MSYRNFGRYTVSLEDYYSPLRKKKKERKNLLLNAIKKILIRTLNSYMWISSYPLIKLKLKINLQPWRHLLVIPWMWLAPSMQNMFWHSQARRCRIFFCTRKMKSNYYYNNHANHKLAKENLAILITNVDQSLPVC